MQSCAAPRPSSFECFIPPATTCLTRLLGDQSQITEQEADVTLRDRAPDCTFHLTRGMPGRLLQ